MRVNLDTLITFKRETTTEAPNSQYGNLVTTWETVGEEWAELQDVMPSRNESMLSDTIEVAKNRTRIRFRWRDDITSADRIEITHPRARTLEIIGGPAEIGGRMMYMELLTEEVS